jgi:hypothetical protein
MPGFAEDRQKRKTSSSSILTLDSWQFGDFGNLQVD